MAIEALGEAVTGSMAARAVEPEAGEAATRDAAACLNCGSELLGDYCHRCGQAGHVHRTVSAFWHDISHSVLHFEGKVWRTLPLLALRPGELTRRYIHGERARFVSPMALFLFSVFLMFAVFNTLGGTAFADRNPDPAEIGKVRQEMEQERSQKVAKLQALRARSAEAARRGAPSAPLDGQIRDLEREIAIEDRVRGGIAAMNGEQGAATADQSGPLKVDIGEVPSALSWLDPAWKKAKENPSLLLYKLQSNGYKFSWALILISVPFLWLLFLHRKSYRAQYRAYDHLVFVTYSISFMSLGVVALTLVKLTGLNGPIVLLVFLIPPIHMYRQLRGAYCLSRRSALWRTLFLSLFAVQAMGIFMLLLVMVGVLG
jgi:hypothetical protein